MYKINKPSKTIVEIKFSADKEEWDKAVQVAYEKTKGEYNIQGFRRGQAPRRLIEKTYGEGVFFEDAFGHIAEEAYVAALTEDKSINPVGEPDVKLEKFVEGKLEGVIVLNVIPEPVLGAYKGLSLEATLMEYNEDMLNHELQHAREHMAVAVPVTDRETQLGDTITLDFLGTLDGVPFDGGKAEDYELKLGSHSFIDNFEDQLVGHKIGDHVEVNVTFPADYGAKDLAGKKAVFNCDIKGIKVFELPELDDDFAKSMGEFETLDAYKADVEAQIRHEIENRNKTIIEDTILDAVVDGSEVELPNVVVEKQLDAVMNDLNNRLMYQGMSVQDHATYLGKTMEEMREQHRKDAEKIAKTKQVLEALVRAEKLGVSEAELDAKLEEFAKMTNKTIEEYKKTMDKRRLDYMYSDILMAKVMDVLKSNNTVTNKSADKHAYTHRRCSGRHKGRDL
ncbi:MAG: trigger factor [Clostridia bacterium]|nr:trigger factor [Clostridia bacterium]